MTQAQKKSISMTNNQIELAKKLQALQNENRMLQQSKDSIQNNIRRLVDDINTRDKLLQQTTSENQQITKKNKELAVTCRKLQLQNLRLNQQYSLIHNYASQQRKQGSRGLVIKEMELSNRLNEIQFEGYSKVIEQMKQALSAKNIEISVLISENGKLKKDLLNTTYQFHEQIYTLKAQIQTLKLEANALLLNQNQNTVSQDNSQSLTAYKIQNLKKEIDLYEKQYASISKQLLQCKSQLSKYKHEAEWLQAKLQKRDPVNRVQFDYQKAKELIDQNNALKKEIYNQKWKMIAILEENPQLIGYVNDVSNPFQQLQSKINQLQATLQIRNNDISKLQESINKISEQKNKADQEIFKTRTKTIKMVDKMKGIINRYVPFINLYGYSEFGLDEQECKFLNENNAGMQKQFDRMSNQLSSKRTQLKKLQTKLKDIEEKLRCKDERIDLLSKNDKQLRQENQKLIATLETLTKKINLTKNQKEPKEEPRSHSYSQELREIFQSESQAVNTDNNFYQEQRSDKVENLKALINELQQERQKCLEIIRSKDLMLTEANAQIAILKSEPAPKFYNFASINQLSSMKFEHSKREKQPINYTQLLQANASHYHEFRQELNTLSQNYENEIRLVNEQFNKKYSALDVKYNQLLNEYSNFQQQYTKLKKAFEESIKKNQVPARVEVGESQQQSNQQIENAINVRDDNNSINESTIQTINQLLKKYQKEINRFTSLYESEMEKANQLKQHNFTSVQSNNLQSYFKQQVERVEAILKENQQTIAVMEKELREKQEQLISERQYYQTHEHIYDQRLAQLEMRCNQLNSQLQHLQRRAIEQNNQQASSNVQQSAILIAVLTSKNNEISSLKEKLVEKQTIIQQNRKDLVLLADRKTDQISQLQLSEFRAFKSYLQQNDLYSLLRHVQSIISEKPTQEQQ